MQFILAAVIALNVGVYELPPVYYTSGVEGAKQAAWDVEEYLATVREVMEDAYVGEQISTDVWEEYDFLDKSTNHYHHLFVMSVLFYGEAPVEDPYGHLVTKSSYEMIVRLTLIQRLLMTEGIEISESLKGLFVKAGGQWGVLDV